MYDIDKIRKVDIIRVADYINMPLKRSGNTWFVECPFHEEQKHDNCTISDLDRSWGYCHSCHKSFNNIDMVEAYVYKKSGQKMPFHKICEIIGDAGGGSELYCTRNPRYASAEQANYPSPHDDAALFCKLHAACPEKNDVQISLKEYWGEKANGCPARRREVKHLF